MFLCRFQNFGLGNILSQIYHMETMIFQHQRYKIFTNVMNIAFYGSNNDYRHFFPTVSGL